MALVSCQREQTQTATNTAPTTTVAKPQNLGAAKVDATLPMNAAASFVQSQLGDGKAAKATFKSGEPIIVTLTLRDSPKGVQLTSKWYDSKNKVMKEDKKELLGQNTATFEWSGKKLKPGKYRVVSMWGANVAGDHKFEVVK